MLTCVRKILPACALISGWVYAASADPSVALPANYARPVPQTVARPDASGSERRSASREESIEVATRPATLSMMAATAPRNAAPVSRNAEPRAAQSEHHQMVQSLDRSAYFVNTVSARMNVTIKRGSAKAMTLDGVYMGDANGNLRLRLTGLFGILAMDVAVKDGTLTCWMPTKKLLVQASRDELLDGAHSELAVLAAVGQARELFFPRAWADGAAQRRLYAGETELRVGVFGGANGRSCLRDYSIDPVEKAIRSLEVLTERGETIGRVDYAQYHPLTKLDNRDDKDKDAGDWRSTFRVPRSLRLADGQRRMTLECAVEGMKVNEPLKAGVFDLDLPKGVVPQKAQALEQMAKEMTGVAAKE